MDLQPYSFPVFVLFGDVYAKRKQERELFEKIIAFPTRDLMDESLNERGKFPYTFYKSVLDRFRTIKIVCEGHINKEGNLEGEFTCQIYQFNENRIDYDAELECISIEDNKKIITFPMKQEDYQYFEYAHYSNENYTFIDYVNFVKEQVPSIPEEYIVLFVVHLQNLDKISPKEINKDEEYLLLSHYFDKCLLPLSDDKITFQMKNGITEGLFHFVKPSYEYKYTFSNNNVKTFGAVIEKDSSVKELQLNINIDKLSKYKGDWVIYNNLLNDLVVA